MTLEGIDFRRVFMYQSLDGTAGCTLSECGRYRYKLWRRWDERPMVVWIMLNPSTADHLQNDPTIVKCMRMSIGWGYGGIMVVNLFAWRETDSKKLKAIDCQTLVGPSNDAMIAEAVADAKLVVAAWGNGGKLFERGDAMRWKLAGANLCSLKITKSGQPYHPLYLRDDTLPVRF